MGEIPSDILRRHPELVSVHEALAQRRRGGPITARCLHCAQPLHVEDIVATHTLVVTCPCGRTLFRAKHGSG
jgi:hypothetical protein